MHKAYWIAGGLLAGAAVMFLLGYAGDLFAQEGPFGGDRPGGRGGFPRMPMGGSAMTSVGKYLFVTNGQTVYKIDPEDMKLVSTLELRPDRPEGQGDDRPGGSGRKGW